VKAMARNSMPHGGFTELVTPCLPHEQPASAALLNNVRKPEILLEHKDEEEVHGVAFGDTELDKIIFHTHVSVSSFSMKQKRIVSKHKLALSHLHCRIRCMAVNPVSRAIVCLLEAPMQADGLCETIITVWPTGVLQEEQLKLSIYPDAPARDLMPSAIVSSASAWPQVFLSRVCTRKVFSWHFDQSEDPLETVLANKGGLIAISSTGRWLAIVEEDDRGTNRVKVWSYDFASVGTTPPVASLVSSLDRNPKTMAIAHEGDTVLLALSDVSPVGLQVRLVEVFAIQPDGKASCVHRLVPESPCRQLSFCIDNLNIIVCAGDDGVVSLHDLCRRTAFMRQDDGGIRAVCVSANRQLILSAYDNAFHVYKAIQSEA